MEEGAKLATNLANQVPYNQARSRYHLTGRANQDGSPAGPRDRVYAGPEDDIDLASLNCNWGSAAD
jgi:hypothetical protein